VLEEGEMSEMDQMNGFDISSSTLFAGNVIGDRVIQITATAIHLLNCSDWQSVGKWEPDKGLRISVGTANNEQIVVALGGGTIVYLDVNETGLEEKG